MTTSFPPHFASALPALLPHPFTGQPYSLHRADQLPAAPARAREIAAVCNEPLVYDRLFRARRQGQPYAAEEAQAFLDWAAAGWQEGTHFVFLLLDADHHVAGALDIKSADLNSAEIGYWLGGAHRGIMTSALNTLIDAAQGAGFQRLWARPDADNTRSVALLERAGFTPYCPLDDLPNTAYFERLLEDSGRSSSR
ncbi:GNAT family N-acetyltransferase [Deinococcus oregonensis]|uniref:GNAT family N-acetyltransferase n=1 Tax=Deinococcus oregonensis TaxID=1805970 RepID=A0ABV6B0R8_9DEIO